MINRVIYLTSAIQTVRAGDVAAPIHRVTATEPKCPNQICGGGNITSVETSLQIRTPGGNESEKKNRGRGRFRRRRVITDPGEDPALNLTPQAIPIATQTPDGLRPIHAQPSQHQRQANDRAKRKSGITGNERRPLPAAGRRRRRQPRRPWIRSAARGVRPEEARRG